MATATIYLCQKFDGERMLCSITGQEKKQIKSKRDDSVGEETTTLKPKTFKVVGEKLKMRLESMAIALEHLIKLEFNKADRCFLWGFDKELIDKINSCDDMQMISELKSDDDDTPNIIHRLYKAKRTINTRIGYQNPENKNRFVSEGRRLVGEREAKLPSFEDALQKARDLNNG